MKITQKKAMFYMLWKSHLKNPEAYIPAWKFVGELYVSELNKWFFMSYKTPSNGAYIFFENPDLIERKWVKGKTGAEYYTYRIKEGSLKTRS
jgi:hypothetical protein